MKMFWKILRLIIILAIIGLAALLFRERKTKIKHYIWG